MAISLENARRKVETFMTENAVVYAPSVIRSLPYAQTAGSLVIPASAPKLYDGPAKFKDMVRRSGGGGSGGGTTEGGLSLAVIGTKIDFPVNDVPEGGFPEGSLIVCTDALRMPQLIGAQYVVHESDLKTFGIQYTVIADRRRAVDL